MPSAIGWGMLSSVKLMIKQVTKAIPSGRGLRLAVVYSQFNSKYVNGMRLAARSALKLAGVEFEEVKVPGAYEIPVIASLLARREQRRPDAIICLGVIWKGATLHAEQIGQAVTNALMTIQVETRIPCVHGVITVETTEQAKERCLDPGTNRGTDAAVTAILMAKLARTMQAG
jgi:6,7-dimethyl-8-ribityllumazine synthase